MWKRQFVALAFASLAWPAIAFGQASSDGAPPPGPGMHDHAADPAAWHKRMCEERYDRTAGRLGYLAAKLNLTDQQHDAWNKWQEGVMKAATDVKATCLAATPAAGAPPSLLDHEANAEKMLAVKLQGLQATRPALEALYATLTPDQKTVMDEMGMRRHHHFGHDWRQG